jgi:hypothetical protein
MRHDPFLESKDELKRMKEVKGKNMGKDIREGQSEYRKKLATRSK